MRRVLLFLIVAAAMLAAGCGDDDQPGGQGADATGPPIRVAVGVDPVFTAVFLAQANELFADEGIEVEVIQFANAGEAADALIAGSADVAGVPDYNLLARASRADLAALAIFCEDPGDYVKVAAREEISDAREMKKIGIVPGTFSEYAAARLVEHAGIDAATVEFVPAGPQELPPLLEKGDVDGFVLWEPWPTRAEEMGGKVLMPTREYGLSTVLTISTTDRWLDGHRREAEALTRAIDAAATATEQDPKAAGAATADAAKIPEALTEQAVGELDFGVREITEDDRADFERIVEYLVERKIVEERPSLDELIAQGYVPGG
jgi:ABC-type nitrate/sulfonate/bicarbonate transport system substrate-binding protein